MVCTRDTVTDPNRMSVNVVPGRLTRRDLRACSAKSFAACLEVWNTSTSTLAWSRVSTSSAPPNRSTAIVGNRNSMLYGSSGSTLSSSSTVFSQPHSSVSTSRYTRAPSGAGGGDVHAGEVPLPNQRPGQHVCHPQCPRQQRRVGHAHRQHEFVVDAHPGHVGRDGDQVVV